MSLLFQTSLGFPIALRLKTQVLSEVTHLLHHLGPAYAHSPFRAFEQSVSSPLRLFLFSLLNCLGTWPN